MQLLLLHEGGRETYPKHNLGSFRLRMVLSEAEITNLLFSASLQSATRMLDLQPKASESTGSCCFRFRLDGHGWAVLQ